ncbi:molybdopterin-synthase adenylyltransferase [Pseudidiomarina salinarum]|uniref:Molybdopterin-synthase adenylyltransferase n=1 Tax=Pseudidiomarina salinarum TaxID=435908 RepID=A0A094ISQ2_9GAMM|nr:molybdopterin-synthase adenylyltransferase MoeB [Pseudidiomarina salinarum]KFZ30720.1 molybdopterin-synthase adenylyltransferase [Pseudidiomarina salinarum]RUO69240.1 molybdopterin-synthase adenylyltransferase MoeB [Pseudidiomarina salinarum]
MSNPELTRDQLLRYSRHVMLPSFDIQGQEALLASHALIIGVGGLGCAVAPYLAASGVGQLTLVDADTIDRHNLQRQTLFTDQQVGELKVEAAAGRLRAINPEVVVHTVAEHVEGETIDALIRNKQVVIDCCDNLATRNAVNAACVRHRVPLVSGAAIRFEGQLACFANNGAGPCYGCLSALFGEQQLSCMESGVLSPVVGVIGCAQAVEALKILAGVGSPLYGRIHLYDALQGEWQQFSLPRHPACRDCN